MELIVEAEIQSKERLEELMDEANQLIAILVTCVKKAKTSKR